MPQAKATRQPAQARSGGAASSSPPSLERCCSLPGGAAATPPGHTALPAHCCAQGSAEQRLPSSASTRRSAKPCTKDTDEDASPWQQTAHARWHHNHTRGRLRTAAVCFHRTDQRVDVGELREHAEQQAEEDDPGQQGRVCVCVEDALLLVHKPVCVDARAGLTHWSVNGRGSPRPLPHRRVTHRRVNSLLARSGL